MNEERCVRLAEKIVGILRQGLKISGDMLHYIDSTFSNPSAECLKSVIADESDCERDPLMSLIFFPDESFQVQLEEFLENENFRKTDEDNVANGIVTRFPEILLYFPDHRGILKVPVSETDAAQFVSRLNISKKTDKRLVGAINRHAAEACRSLLKVKLRNARFVFTENKILFLCDFFEKAGRQADPAFRSAGSARTAWMGKPMDFILRFFDELRDDQDIFQALADKKNFCFRNLQKQTDAEEQLKKNTMETLMAQGLRIPYTDKADTLDKMAMIDFISFTVFGKSDVPEYLMAEPDVRIYKILPDLGDHKDVRKYPTSESESV